MGAGFTAFKLLLRYLDACGKSTDCLFSEKKKIEEKISFLC